MYQSGFLLACSDLDFNIARDLFLVDIAPLEVAFLYLMMNQRFSLVVLVIRVLMV